MKRLQCHDHLNRRTVGVGNDAHMIKDHLRVHFRHDKGNVGFHAKRAAVVDDKRAVHRRGRCEFFAHRRAGRKEGQLDVVPGEDLVREFLNGNILSFEFDLLSDGTARCERDKFLHGEIPFFEHLNHFSSDHAGSTGDNHIIELHLVSILSCSTQIFPSGVLRLKRIPCAVFLPHHRHVPRR